MPVFENSESREVQDKKVPSDDVSKFTEHLERFSKQSSDGAGASLEGSGVLPRFGINDNSKDQKHDKHARNNESEMAAAAGAAASAAAHASMNFDPNVRSETTAPLEEGQFTKNAIAIFDRIDKDEDGIISDKEISTAMQDQTFVNEDAQTVAALYKGRNALEHLAPYEYFRDSALMIVRSTQSLAGISKSDIEEYGKIRGAAKFELEGANNAKAYLKKNFASLDNDGNGAITFNEIAAATAKTTDTRDQKGLAYLAYRYDSIRGEDTYFGSSTISKKDFDLYYKNVSESSQSKAVQEVSNGIYFTAQNQIPGKNYSLFADADNPLKNITVDAVKQQSIGDCYFEAGLASLVLARPNDVLKMIKDNDDGTYTVTFPGAPNEPVTVKKPTEAELGIYNAASEYGVWANVIEKAFGKYRQEHNEKQKDSTDQRTPTEGADGGGQISEAMSILSPRPSEIEWCDGQQDDEIFAKFKDALGDERPRMITAGTPGESDRERLDSGYVQNHAYSVVRVREDDRGNKFVSVRNPWGGEHKDGTSEMPFAEFRKTFPYYCVEPKN
ncbi:MAG: hypothetical protein IAF58_17510 [Leptolyngbya sp.]|nr:hypothetical protein [Candidatus Melainabacteria bacterium]